MRRDLLGRRTLRLFYEGFFYDGFFYDEVARLYFRSSEFGYSTYPTYYCGTIQNRNIHIPVIYILFGYFEYLVIPNS